MNNSQLLTQQGLYQTEFEHDACGIGFYANLKGHPSHSIVTTALEMLHRLDHRAGKNADNTTSDGAGILVQIPHAYFTEVCSFSLPQQGEYAVGMLFFKEKETALRFEETFEQFLADKPLSLLGFRHVPVNHAVIGEQAKAIQPFVSQVFVKTTENNAGNFLKNLYLMRKQIEKTYDSAIYIPSFSSTTIVYKGMLSAEQLPLFYVDLQDLRFSSSLALIHSRFSTNTFPSWDRAHPNRMLAHNGEINTIKGNKNWFHAKTTSFESEFNDIYPVINGEGSDSAMFDNVLEFLSVNGYSLAESIMMMVPEPWEHNDTMPKQLQSFYRYYSQFMEPWDGPMALGFTDGKQIGAALDRNGLRPARYYITKDDHIIFASEVGVVDIDDALVKEKRQLKPGHLLFIDLEEGRIIPNDELKAKISAKQDYDALLKEHVVTLDINSNKQLNRQLDNHQLLYQQQLFGYTYEEVMKTIKPMVETKKETTASMGIDTPIAVLSDKSQLLFHYFKQGFSQVTNPPIDAIREAYVISTLTWLGSQHIILNNKQEQRYRLQLDHPLLDTKTFQALHESALKVQTLPIYYNPALTTLEDALDTLFTKAEQAVSEGYDVLVLSDEHHDNCLPIASLLAVSGLHQHLINKGARTKVSIVLHSAEPRDTHHAAVLIGYGADAIHPYLALETIKQLIDQQHLTFTYEEAEQNYLYALLNGVVKTMSKVGISSIQSYRGAQTFEALGLSTDVVNRYFTGTPTQIDGISLTEIEKETMMRYEAAIEALEKQDPTLESGSELQWRSGGEHHIYNPLSIHTLQRAARTNDKEIYRKFSEMQQNGPFNTIRSLLTINSNRKPISIDEVESVPSLFKRFKTGAMSYGSISKEAHEALAIAMNKIGGRSNSGEGGEDSSRYLVDANGDKRRSAIKQVASARFGVTSYYLAEADEIQIKMAQGAKPGEGGQLPGSKVYPWVAEVRGSTTGVGLISPPPHHDIYSIEDLAQLIYDLKSANPRARISVKLAAKAGVGTIAAGVAKGLADTILISGHDGGTGASPKSSLKHAGIPWEIGLAEAHQTLLLNGLRDRVVLETDGKLLTGRDVIIAACLGAEEFGFSTAPLIVLGCVMMRACHLDTCPVGVATQNPELRAKFTGTPDHVVNYMTFVAEEIRELLAEMGFTSIDELIGETQLLSMKPEVSGHWKAKYINLEKVLFKPDGNKDIARKSTIKQEHDLEKRFDQLSLLPICIDAVKKQYPVSLTLPIRNEDRSIGTSLGYYISSTHGEAGLPEDSIQVQLYGSAGQSLGAFIPKGLTITLDGDANDYVGKGLSGGKLIVRPSSKWSQFHDQAIIGNTTFFGATSGEAFIAGQAGQRFCVRNSGANVVVEGIGDHGCEYMTGGRAVILGVIGKNFAAGMSGGVAYIYQPLAASSASIHDNINKGLVSVENTLEEQEAKEVFNLISKHARYTGSLKATHILENWNEAQKHFIKVIPQEYKNVISLIDYFEKQGMSPEDAKLTAFQYKKENKAVKILVENSTYSSVETSPSL